MPTPSPSDDRLPLTPKNGGVRILAKKFQDLVMRAINGNRIISVLVPQTDGSNVLPPKQADIKTTEFGTVITMPPAGAANGSSSGGGGGVNYQTTNYTAISTDTGKLISFKNTSALTLTLPATPPSATWWCAVECIGAGGLTIYRNSLNIDTAAADVVLIQNQGLLVYTDGANYFTMRGTASNTAQMFVIKSISNADYIVANTWDGTTRGGTDINIAKSPRLRPSVASESIDGVTITYSAYTSDNTRTASDGATTEYQVAFPRYSALASGNPASNQEMSIIFAVPATTGIVVSSVPVTWVEVSPARVWARRYIQ